MKSRGMTASRGMSAASFEGYGEHVFKGAVAAPYLTSVGLSADTLDTPAWTSNGNADKVMINFVLWNNIQPIGHFRDFVPAGLILINLNMGLH